MCNVSPSGFRCRALHYLPLIGVLCISLLSGCDSGTAPSIYDPDRTSLPDPIIDSVAPDGSALAGVDMVTITGNNFSSQPTENLVYFGDARSEVTGASPTQLHLVAPNKPLPELMLRVSVIGAENFSNSVPYKLEPPFVEFGDVRDFENVYGIATDMEGNVYVSFVAHDLPVGITRITPDGERSEFVSSRFFWTDLDIGLDGYLYAVRSVRALFRFQEGSSQEVFAVIPNTATKLTTIAIDENGRVWAAGNNSEIYSISPDKTVSAYGFESDIRDLALFGNHLYVAGLRGGSSKVWRFRINSDGELESPEEVFDVSAFSGREALALAITTSGHLYIGTDADDPIIVVDPDGKGEALYPGVLSQSVRQFAWGPLGYLFAATNRTGISAAGIIRITTRRLGSGKLSIGT